MRDACDGFIARAAIAASLTADERREILRGMILTRAIDNRLKQFFSSSDVRYKNTPFKGRDSAPLGQEAIYAAGIRLRRGAAWRNAARGWQGDVVGPIIRDLGVSLAMRSDDDGDSIGAERADGQGWTADGRQGSAHRRFRLGRAPGDGTVVDQHDVDCRHRDGIRASEEQPGRRVVHRRRRLVARRVARGDQPVRGPAPAGVLLPREQPDRPVDARAGTVGGACVC